MRIDILPEFVRNSNYLTGNQLTRLATLAEVQKYDDTFFDQRVEALLTYMKGESLSQKLHEYARELMEQEKIHEAWQVLLRHPNNQN